MIEKKSKSIDWYSRKIFKGTRVGILRHHKYLISLDSFQTFNKFFLHSEKKSSSSKLIVMFVFTVYQNDARVPGI